ncbi:hypothetical protein J437_LFUL016291 [Ladona fulva]|uniref:TLC domain-containing protein n=1 Tax=Ladona fulva TaxID=123851 RepID=A0A8K0KMB0_LADFU|nr:hypothetical protein J437_LFUL016291 [Ladona fulva]
MDSESFAVKDNVMLKKQGRGGCMAPAGSLLLATVLGSLGTAAGSILVLNPEDRISVTRGVWLSLLGLVFFVSLYDLVNYIALRTSPGLRLVSAVQACLSCVTGAVVCWWSCPRNFLRSSHYMSEAYAWFGMAYFFYDIWSMYHVHSHDIGVVSGGADMKGMSANRVHGVSLEGFWAYFVRQPVIVLHHIFIGSFGFLVIVYFRGGLGDCVFGFVYLMELSTPFVSLRGILSKLKLKSSLLYVVNGITMLVTFFFCRVIMFPYVCYMYARFTGLPYWKAISSLPTTCKAGIAVLMMPQVYWFILMVQGAVKVLCFGEGKSKEKNRNLVG